MISYYNNLWVQYNRQLLPQCGLQYAGNWLNIAESKLRVLTRQVWGGSFFTIFHSTMQRQ